MNIQGISSAMGPQGVDPVGQIGSAAGTQQAAGTGDVVEISTAARLAARIRDIPDVRADLVAQVKADIAAGTYESSEKIDIAVNRLLDEMLGG